MSLQIWVDALNIVLFCPIFFLLMLYLSFTYCLQFEKQKHDEIMMETWPIAHGYIGNSKG